MIHEPRRYTILEPIGRGGFGVVYRAEQRGMDGFQKPVALKFLRAEHEPDPELAARFRDEARMLGLLSHGAFVRVDGLIRLAGQRAMVLEYVDGADLSTLLKPGPLPMRPALQIASTLAAALDHAHHRVGPGGVPLQLLHRDLKPSNLRITASGELKVLDLGAARASFEGREGRTVVRHFGTASYMAPERLLGHDGPAGDVYALGAVLFELLTGDPPRGRPTVPGQTSRRSPDQLWRALGELCQRACPTLPALMEDILDDEPERRPDLRALRGALDALASAVEGPLVERWAERAVPAAQARVQPLEGDELTGQTLVEETLSVSTSVPHAEPRPTRRLARLGVLALLLGGLGAGLVPRLKAEVEVVAPPAAAPLAAAHQPEPEFEPKPGPEPVTTSPQTPRPPPAPAVRRRAPQPRSASPTPALGAVLVTGDVPLDLAFVSVDPSAPERRPVGPLPAGDWKIYASFRAQDAPGPAGTLHVLEGQTTTIICKAALRRCR